MLKLTEKKNKFLNFFFKIYFKLSLKRNFYRINIKGKELLDTVNRKFSDENIPVIICVNHSNWWDGVLANWISNYFLKGNSYCIMDTEDLIKHRYFNKIGAIPLERENKFRSYRTLKFCIGLLQKKNIYLWIFPQGKILPNESRPFKFYNGVSFLCENLDRFQLLCIQFEFRFTAEQRPEIFMDFFKIFGKEDISLFSRNEFTAELERVFSLKADEFIKNFGKSDLNGYEILEEGKKSINERRITQSV